MTDQFADQNQEFALQNQQLQRRRELARSLIEQAAGGNSGSGYQGGKVYIVGSPLPNIANAVGGAYLNNKADAEQQDLASRQAQAQNDWQAEYANASTPAEKQAALTRARNSGLRHDLEKQFYELDAKQNEAEAIRQAKATEAATEKEANRTFLEEQKRLDRENQKALRAMPTTHVTVSNRSGAGFKVPSGYMLNKDGDGVVPIPGIVPKAPPADKPLTENQGNAVLYGARASEADKVLDTVGSDYSAIKADMAHASTNVPGVGSLVNAGLSGNEQKVVQAQRDFVNAIMRRESGAAIATSEFANARKQYFPQPGDSTEVLAQKRANRALVTKGLAEISGPSGKKAIEAITPKDGGPTVVRTGTRNGVKIQQMSDGTIREVK